jgi:murein DD-endopeptidase MepM/ murein hydrolase activator NlpD
MRIRLLLALVAAVVLASVGVSADRWWKHPEPPPEVTASREDDADVTNPAAEIPEQTTRIARIELKRGDSFLSALTRNGITERIGQQIATALQRSGANLKRLRPRDAVEVTYNLDGEPIAVGWEPSPWLGYVVISTDGGWTVRRQETPPDVRVEAVRGKIARSLFDAVEEAGEKPGLVMDLVSIFESEFDFTADTRAGDRFRVLVEKRYAGETFVDYGRVLAAQYASDERVLTGIGYEPSGARFGYFDPGGRSLRKSFLKSPLEFSRITSGFTYARPHPILGGVRPHLAIDYAAPVGTPVRAVADATVVRAGWNGGNGISVTLRHQRGYETMYNHLSRLGPGVGRGTRIKQRQVIGYVGSTGLSTGPHLDYRIARHGVFVNPLGEKFIPGEPLTGTERTLYQRHARALLARLERDAAF